MTVVRMGNDAIINDDNARINSVFCVLTTLNLLLSHPVCELIELTEFTVLRIGLVFSFILMLHAAKRSTTKITFFK